MKANEQQERAPTIRDLFPTFSEEELKRAEEKLRRYAALLSRIWEGIHNDPVRLAEFQRLTAGNTSPTMKARNPREPAPSFPQQLP